MPVVNPNPPKMIDGERLLVHHTVSITLSTAEQINRIRVEFGMNNAEVLRMLIGWGIEYYLWAKYQDWDSKL